jgi:hypothetical protein
MQRIVALFEEDGSTAIAPLRHVVWEAGHDQAGPGGTCN